MRLVTACISHESSTFTPVPTTYESFFERFGDVRGRAVVETFRGTNTPIGSSSRGPWPTASSLCLCFTPRHTRAGRPRGPTSTGS